MSKVIRLADRVAALEAARRDRAAYRMSKAERDALVARSLADHVTMAKILAEIPADEHNKRAAIAAAMRADL